MELWRFVSDYFECFQPTATMASLTWDQIQPDINLRNILESEVEDHLAMLEEIDKKDISVTCYDATYEQVMGIIVDIKELHSTFHKKQQTTIC